MTRIKYVMSKISQNTIVKFFTKQASLNELDQLAQWVKDPSNKEEFIKYIKINHAIDFNMGKFGTENSKKKLLKFIEQEKKAHKIRRILNFSKYAALILIFVGLGYVLKNRVQDITPGPLDSKTVVPVT